MAKRTGPFYFTVCGSGDFPVDMLRYDACWPYNGEDSAAIQPIAYAGKKELRSVVLETNNPNAPTIARWNSFTWYAVHGVDRLAHERVTQNAIAKAEAGGFWAILGWAS